MGAAAVAPALKPLSIAFPESSAVAISLVVTLPALAVAITGLGVGYLADRYGKARVFIISLIVFTLAGMSATNSASVLIYLIKNSKQFLYVMSHFMGCNISHCKIPLCTKIIPQLMKKVQVYIHLIISWTIKRTN